MTHSGDFTGHSHSNNSNTCISDESDNETIPLKLSIKFEYKQSKIPDIDVSKKTYSFEDNDGSVWGIRKSTRSQRISYKDTSDSDSEETSKNHKVIEQPRKIPRKKLGQILDDKDSSLSEEDEYTKNNYSEPIRFSTRSTKRSVQYKKDIDSEDEDEDIKKKSKLEHLGIVDFSPESIPLVIESIMDHKSQSDITNIDMMKSDQVEYLIKWKSLSHLHDSWNTYSQLEEYNIRKVDTYIQQQLEFLEDRHEGDWKEEHAIELELNRVLYEEYKIPEHILDERVVPIKLDDEDDELLPRATKKRTMNELFYHKYYLVKWKNLPYSECTWESQDLLLPKYEHLIDVDQPSIRRKKQRHYDKHRPKFIKMDTQPVWLGNRIQSNDDASNIQSLILRDYQLAGLNWLAYSWHNNTSTILADEMGLGKTIQTVSFLSYLYHEMDIPGPFLLVVPLSTIHAWQKEFQKWAPMLRVIMYIGDLKSRSILSHYEFYYPNTNQIKFHVLLTTYELILKDASKLSTIRWSALIVDEAHRLKNVDSLLYKSLKEQFQPFDHRLLITGTPLQNSLKELYALLSFLEPSKFPNSWEIFENELMNSGSHNGNMESIDETISLSCQNTSNTEYQIKYLHELLKPHLLRRLKKDVEKSLPGKDERILRVDMSPLQKQLYKWILTKNYQELNKCYGSLTNTKMTSLLNILGELRKTANHPYLIHNGLITLARELDSEGIIYHSGKMILLDALLKRLLPDDNRILIFSQSVAMLDILEEYLHFGDIKYLRLDGSVPSEQRKSSIEAFNHPSSNYKIFLLSTRAGGLGINLETANIVILFDSDWNPQNDLQAMARAHRIGQKRNVSIYRFVSKNSVEEEILERAKKKMVLDHLVIQKMDTSGRLIIPKKLDIISELEDDESLDQESKKRGGNALQSILMFGAKALFDNDKQEQKQSNDKLLFHQLTMPSNIMSGIRDILPNETNAEHTIFAKPNYENFKLDDILSNAVEADTTKDDNADRNDKELMNQFKVADLSDALTWDTIIPEQERKDMDQVNQDIQDRQQVMEMYQSYEKRQMIKQDARLKMSEKVKDKESPKTKKINTTKESKKKASQFDQMFEEIYGHGVSFDIISKILSEMNQFGLERIENRNSNDHHIGECIIDACNRYLNQPQDKDKKIGRVSLYRQLLFPSTLIKHVEHLDKLSLVIRKEQHKEMNVTMIEIPLYGQIKKPTGWNVPWSSRDDQSLLIGVHEHGYGNWKAIALDPKLGLEKKLSLLNGVASEPNENNEKEQHYLPDAQCIKKRVDYLLDHLEEKPKSKKKLHYYQPKEILKNTQLLNFFKKIFKPLKKTFLSFSDMDSGPEFESKKKEILDICSSFIAKMLSRWNEVIIEYGDDHLKEMMRKLEDSKEIILSLWSFVLLCWPEHDSLEDVQEFFSREHIDLQ